MAEVTRTAGASGEQEEGGGRVDDRASRARDTRGSRGCQRTSEDAEDDKGRK